ncbi:condensation domain-containing protein [Allorhizobium undicola]|uniref:condensation domain-containing protein n=1 Tax=Allorhizobium undicola TaxID=78527 RepID=UPI00048927B5|nr:condensation domain-containing protein [Allorhizobium undicola]
MSARSHAAPALPLTLPQLDFWEEFCCHPDEPLSTVAHGIEVRGEVDEAALIRAIETTIAESDVLCVEFVTQGAENPPRQRLDPARRPALERIDLRHHADPAAEAEQRMKADVEAELDLTRDRLSAQILFRLGEQHYLWYLRAHHIIVDGYGLTLMENRCGQLYSHFAGVGQAGPSFHAYPDFLDEEEAYRTSPRHKSDGSFWRDYVAGLPPLPVLSKEAEDYGAAGLHHKATLPGLLSERLAEAARELRMGWPDLLTLLSGLYLNEKLVGPWRHQANGLTLWLPFMSRWGSVGAHMPAMLVNILPLHISRMDDETLRGFLSRMSATMRKQRIHGRYRIEEIAADYGIAKGSRFFFSPLINVLPFSAPTFGKLEVRRRVLANGPGDGFNLTYRGEEDGSDLSVSMDCDTLTTDVAAFEKHKAALPAFLAAALEPGALDRPIASLATG